ncbi:MAG: hypothetical protein ABSE49_12165 [Polyangiaceae bacterium]
MLGVKVETARGRAFGPTHLALSLIGLAGLLVSAAHADATASSTPVPAPAAQAAAPAPVLFDLGGGTYFPLMIGAEGTLELPYRILVQADLGWMPAPYANTIIDVLGDFGAIDSFQQSLLESAIQNSFVARLSAGWRPFPKLGLEILGGYTLVTAGGAVTGTDVVDAYLQSKGSSDRFTGSVSAGVPLHTTLQSVHATVDWRFLLLGDKLVLRASLGYLQCFTSSTSVTATPLRPAGQESLNKLNADLQGYLNPYFTEYVKVPILGVNAAYRF